MTAQERTDGMSDADREMAVDLVAAWYGDHDGHSEAARRDQRTIAAYNVAREPKHAAALAGAARRIVTAELAAKAMPDEGALVEAMVRARDTHLRDVDNNDQLGALGAAFAAIRPHLAALQARAEAAEAENKRLRERPKWARDPAYEPKTLAGKLGYLVEECGEVLAAVGKTQRWGLENFNPELPPEKRETNREWVLREMLDLERAIGMVRAALAAKS